MTVLREVLAAMAADESIVDEVVAAARTASAEVARLPEAENRRHIAVMVAAGIAAVDDPGEAVFAAAAALGADRAAQGVPIEALLRGVHAGRTRAVELALARAETAGVPPEDMLAALVAFTRYAGELERHVVAGYHRAVVEASHTHVLRRLLHGENVPDEDVARAGLRVDGRYHCVLADVSDPVRARALERRFAGGVVGLVDGRLAALTPHPPTGFGDDLVVVAPPAPPADAPAHYELCRTAVRAAAGLGLGGVHALTDLAGETALAAQPVLGALLVGEYLGALDRADSFHRQLVRTASTYLDHGQRVDQTAAALHVHPNTVRYRLSRLSELTGAPLEPGDATTVLATLRWWWALNAWL
ncbi:PucR family transcriptional regulator [Actinophytocola gossypii]|uniref:Helix-turn-helix domain-containing protein n=1 Tax=Actinophytocola gossypii TaxID=2812003 RepID=A0ABT2JHL3_9PSEU|nr:helix-turn-helix domain-containing protein [Actinophytocola gossypii]MCT2587201.1 helix-turn-helix domain-containing protein [Actinophytocola gossypii]